MSPTYRRSSLWRYTQKQAPAWLDGASLLQACGLRNDLAGWRAYAVKLGVLMGDKEAREKLNAKHLSRGWCIGSKEFKKTMQESLRDQLSEWLERRFLGLEPDELKAERAATWMEALQAYAAVAGVDLAKLPSKKSADEKVLLAAAMKQATSASNGWLTEKLGMGEAASVSQFVRRCMLDKERRRRVEAILSKVKV